MKALEANTLFTEELYVVKSTVVVIIPTPWSEVHADHILLLSKILGSVKLQLQGVTILTMPTIDFEIVKMYKPNWILSFGSKVPETIKPYSPESYNGFKIIQSDALPALDETKKKGLWSALKLGFQG